MTHVASEGDFSLPRRNPREGARRSFELNFVNSDVAFVTFVFALGFIQARSTTPSCPESAAWLPR